MLRVSSPVIYIHDFYFGVAALFIECSNLSSHSLRSRQKSFSFHYHEDTYLGLRVSSPVIYFHDFYLGLVAFVYWLFQFIKMMGWRISLIHPNVLGSRQAEGWKFSEYLSICVCVVARRCIPRTFIPLRACFREHFRFRELPPRTFSISTLHGRIAFRRPLAKFGQTPLNTCFIRRVFNPSLKIY